MNTHLTNLETLVLSSFITNYDNAADEISDNATYTDTSDIVSATNLDINTVKGVCGSLVKKGLIAIDPPRNGQPQCFYLEDKGIEIFYQLKV